ncbi:MAG: hypothetical protein M3Y07_10470 [Acidobacteriota bacterium]|nr:hypothetical protein [Acidobacteriota bacterium]
MSQFLDQARHLWDVAGAAAASGAPDAAHTILIHPENGIRVVSDSDWPLDSLQAFHGARTAYRVTCSQGRTRVEGRTRGQSCVLVTDTAGAVARRMLIDRPAYLVNPTVTGAIASR